MAKVQASSNDEEEAGQLLGSFEETQMHGNSAQDTLQYTEPSIDHTLPCSQMRLEPIVLWEVIDEICMDLHTSKLTNANAA